MRGQPGKPVYLCQYTSISVYQYISIPVSVYQYQYISTPVYQYISIPIPHAQHTTETYSTYDIRSTVPNTAYCILPMSYTNIPFVTSIHTAIPFVASWNSYYRYVPIYPYTLDPYTIHHIPYSIQHTAYTIQHTAYSIQHTAYSILYCDSIRGQLEFVV
jgi:hypothetical protein